LSQLSAGLSILGSQRADLRLDIFRLGGKIIDLRLQFSELSQVGDGQLGLDLLNEGFRQGIGNQDRLGLLSILNADLQQLGIGNRIGLDEL
jgi:hypothetical protein